MRALNRPTSWWGWHWEPPTPLSVVQLIQAGNMDTRLAALLWVAMERGASLIVAADPPSSGKTTTLSALMAFAPPDTAVYFTRGVGEAFALPPVSRSYHTYLLVNEMSDHIPVYTWGDDARRVFELLVQGYRLGTTMHADTVQGVLDQLEGDLQIPKTHVANLTLIMPLYIGRGYGVVRRVQEVVLLRPNGDAYMLSVIATWDQDDDTFHLFTDDEGRQSLAAWTGLTPEELDAQIEARSGFLQTLLTTGITAIPQVGEAIEGYYARPPSGG
jgi:hypothetical protein